MAAGDPSMKEIAGKIDTVCKKVEKIEDDVSSIKETQQTMRETQVGIGIHLANIVDPPSLETRLKAYADEKDTHKQANSQQALLQVQKVLELQTENVALKLAAQIQDVALAQARTEHDRALNHSANQVSVVETDKRITRLERAMYTGIGIVVTLQFVLKFLFSK